jgi:hypothetical protein
MFETMIENFMLALVDHNVKGFALSPPALAALALYHFMSVFTAFWFTAFWFKNIQSR